MVNVGDVAVAHLRELVDGRRPDAEEPNFVAPWEVIFGYKKMQHNRLSLVLGFRPDCRSEERD